MVPPDAGAPTDLEIQTAIGTLRRAGHRRVQSLGYHVTPNDYYSPCNDLTFLEANKDLWDKSDDPLDIDWSPERQLAIARMVARFVEELRDVPQTSNRVGEFCWKNLFWNNADALVQYGLVRARKPRRVVEVGCGWSSLLLSRALGKNESEPGSAPAQVTQIEPYPRRELLATLPADWKLHECILQRAPIDLFTTLEPGDILFYDGSHCSKAGSDVNWFFFEILPRVRPGVLIHLHDIFLPFDYPSEWIFKDGRTWNEQYVLRAFLMNNPRYQIEIANRYLWKHHRANVERLYAGVQSALGCSLWMSKV